MSDAPKYRDEKLPITEEVGGEGGSFADPTYQEAGKNGVRSPGLRRDDRPENDTAGQATDEDEIAGGGVGTNPDPADGMKKYPTE